MYYFEKIVVLGVARYAHEEYSKDNYIYSNRERNGA